MLRYVRLPDGVGEILALLQRGLAETLGDKLVGLYLRGSLAMGDFDPDTSDVDFLAITREPVAGEDFRRLVRMHRGIAATGTRYAHHLEGAYMDERAARIFDADNRRHPEILAGKDLLWSELRDNWVLERWVVRERGIALIGPPARSLIAPVSTDELGAAVRSEIARRVEDWASDEAEPPHWLRARFMQAFETETMCRALYTLRFGELCSKPAAVRWACEVLPPPWREFIAELQLVRADQTNDPAYIDPLRALVRWCADEGVAWAAET